MTPRAALLALALAVSAVPAAAQEKPRDWQPPPLAQIPNHRQIWRDVITELASYAKTRNPAFIVLVRGGPDLLVKGDRESLWEELRDPTGANFAQRLPTGSRFRPYLKVLDGYVADGLYCGPYKLDKPLAQMIQERRARDAQAAEDKARGIHRQPVPQPIGPFSIDPAEEMRKATEAQRLAELGDRQRRMVLALDTMRSEGRPILSVENCANDGEVRAALAHGQRDHVVTFAAVDDAMLDRRPVGHAPFENSRPVTGLPDLRNWLPMLRGERFGDRAHWMMALQDTNFDAVLVDVALRGSDLLVKSDIAGLKYKALGAPRLVLADLPIGRAFDTRWYWQKGWGAGNPSFLYAVDKEPGAFITDLQDPQWKEILGKYIAGIVDLGFDGVVIDDLDTYRWYEDLMPLKD